MGAPDSGMQAAEQTSAEALLSAFKTIDPAERRKHASVLNYWLSIRGDKEFPPLHDLDPLEISDAGPNSVLLELISGGHDAEIRHVGEALRVEGRPERIIDAATPSLLASIAKKLPIVAISRDFLAFEDEFATLERSTRCWVTLLPLSAGGAWVDYVYGFVSLDVVPADAAETAKAAPKKAKPAEPVVDASEEAVEAPAAEESVAGEAAEAPAAEEAAEEPVGEEAAEEPVAEEAAETPVAEEADEPSEPQAADESVAEEGEDTADPALEEPAAERLEPPVAPELPEESATTPDDSAVPPAEADAEAPASEAAEHGSEEEPLDEIEDAPRSRPGFSKLLDNLVGLTGFYGHGYKVDPIVPGASDDQAPMEATEESSPAAVDEHAAEGPEPPPQDEPVAELGLAPDEPEAAAEPAADEQATDEPAAAEPAEAAAHQSAPSVEGSLQTKLADVRAKADEARQAKLRANVALYEGLSAAYDFALDAEDAPEDYLRLVEAEGLKIQLRSPMRPVVKLAFNGMCDEATIRQLEAVLAWALDNELPRGSLAEQIEAAGGIGPILTGDAPSS